MSLTLPSLASAVNQLVLLIPTRRNDPKWLDNPALAKKFIPTTLDTLAVMFFAAVSAVLIGLPLGLLLVQTSKSGLTPNHSVYQFASAAVNAVRSFLFLTNAIVPLSLTRLTVGTTLEWQVTVAPLAILSVPFFARLIESNIPVADMDKAEAIRVMGASNWQIRWGVQVCEATSALVQSITTFAITLVGYPATAGALGGGGLGQMIMNYDYNHFQDDVAIATVLVTIVIVQIVQMFGNMISRLVGHR